MFSVHACAVRSTLVGRACYKSFPRNIVNSSLRGVQARGKVSSASTAETTQSAPDDAVKAGELNHSVIEEENPEEQSTPHTPISYRLVGKERLEKWKKSMKELRGLQRELSSLYGTKRLRPRHFPSEYGVGRLSLLDRELDSPLITVRENKIFHRDLYIPNLWLRDNCQCGSCVHEATRQRLLDTFSIPKDISIVSLQEADGVFAIEWSDGHSSSYSKGFLARAHQTSSVKSIIRNGLDFVQLWDSSIASKPPFVSYEQAMGNHMLYLLRRIRQYGFVYVDETPPRAWSTKKLLERISFIRQTHYGGFYDFTSDLASKDTAYTNMALEAHTDTTYFSDPAGLQAFHLLSHMGGEGGASLLVDGFKVAEDLRIADPKAYDILATVNVHAHSSGNEGISIQPYRGFPVLEHDRATGELLRVRWNSSDRASIELPLSEVETWYDAARKFDALLKKKENEYWAQLRPGVVLIFDNWRVLHGRSAFTGERRICGAYLNRDDWISKYKMLQMREQEVLDALPFS